MSRPLALTAVVAVVASLAPGLVGSAGAAPSAVPATAVADRVFDRLRDFTLPEGDLLDGARVRVRPAEFAAYDVDVAGLATRLSVAPTRGEARRGADPTRVTLPDPTGIRRTFEVVEDSVLQRGLQAKFPDLRFYAGRDVADPTRTIRLDVTPMGVHASVRGLGGRHVWYLDPAVNQPGTTEHLSYFAAALPEGPALVEKELVESVPAPEGAQRRQARARTAPDGLVSRRTYRLAMVTDPTYAQYFGPGEGVPAEPEVVISEIATLMNRVNQIYNDDFALFMVMADGSDELNLDTMEKATGPDGPCGVNGCYTEAQITGGCTGGLLTRNQFVTGQIVGADNFDVGHIMLGINGGGIAGLGVVGEERKAAGCTGLPFPEGDFMAIDYVAHEIGHQFAGNHTFNGTQGNCSGGNRNAGTSVEPGSGSSVMAYAGICATDDLQPHTDPYFSQRSIDEVTAHVTGATTAYSESQTLTFYGFDTDGDTVNLRYDADGDGPAPTRVTSIVRGFASYNLLAVTSQMQALTGAQVTLEGYDGTPVMLNDGGFTVNWPDTADHPRIEITGVSDTGGDPMDAYVGVPVEGGPGGNQGFLVEQTSNHAPVVTAPAARTIPQRTPFTMTGSATDSDGDELIYLWEQNDVGGTTGTALTSNTKTAGPLFRVFGTKADVSLEDSLMYESPGQNAADGNPSRTFPDLDQVLRDNTNAATGSCPAATTDAEGNLEDVPLECYSEFLPNSARTLNFRLTARDLFPTGGGTQFADVALTVGSAGPFRVTSQPAPAAGAPQTSVVGGQTAAVTWDVAGTNTATYAQNVRILLSTDGGQSFDTVLAQSTPNDGTHDVTWPQIATDEARIKVEAVGNYFFDVNRADFSIVPSLSVQADTEQTATQYSDSLPQPVTVTVSAAQVDGDELGLEVSGLAGLAATPISATADGVRPGVATFSVDGPVTGPVGAAEVTLTGTAPGVDATTDTVDVTVQPEDAEVDYTGETEVEQDGDPTPVRLAAQVTDAADGEPGDLTTARVVFVDRENDDAELCTATPDASGAAECGALLDLDGDTTSYTVGTTLAGRYFRDSAADDVTVTVEDSDQEAPETTITAGPPNNAMVLVDSRSFTATSSEPDSTFSCALEGVAVDCPGGSVTLGGFPQGSLLFSAAATDGAGNTDPTPATRRFGVPFDATRLQQDTERWKSRRGGRYYEGRFLRADRRGERLGFEVVEATKLVLLATKGPGHGKVRVFLGGQKIKNVNLQRKRGKSTQRITLARFDVPRTGGVEIKTLRNKQVKIEGLGVIDTGE